MFQHLPVKPGASFSPRKPGPPGQNPYYSGPLHRSEPPNRREPRRTLRNRRAAGSLLRHDRAAPPGRPPSPPPPPLPSAAFWKVRESGGCFPLPRWPSESKSIRLPRGPADPAECAMPENVAPRSGAPAGSAGGRGKKAYQDRDKPAQIRFSNISAAKGISTPHPTFPGPPRGFGLLALALTCCLGVGPSSSSRGLQESSCLHHILWRP